MKNHRFWYIMFSIISVLGVADIASKTAKVMADTDLGVVSVSVSWILALPFLLFSENAAAMAMGLYTTVLDLIFSLVILWIPIALYERKQMRKPKPTTPTGATIK